jgi:opacity protein-like surface antigen
MSAAAPTHRLTVLLLAISITVSAAITPAYAQAAAQPPSRSIDIGGYAMVGRFNIAATESFDAILGEHAGTIFGGGARIGIPLGGLFVDVGAWRFRGEGERVFVSGGTAYPLGIPVEVTMTPLEVSGGWRFRFRQVPKLIPYVAGGFTSMQYRETSDFAEADEDIEETFNGYHLSGGAEYKITRWLGVAGEVAWTTVPDAIGEAGVSEAFDEHDLGGTTFRFKITIGR